VLQTLIGTDIADLLLDGHEPPSRSFSRAPDSHLAAAKSDRQLAEASRDSITPDRSLVSQETSSSDNSTVELTDRFRHLLLHGRKKVNLLCSFSILSLVHKSYGSGTVVSIIFCRCTYCCLENCHGKITGHYSRYCIVAFCCVHKCELSYMCPGHDIKLNPYE